MVIPAFSGTVDGYTSDWRISRHPRIKLLSTSILARVWLAAVPSAKQAELVQRYAQVASIAT